MQVSVPLGVPVPRAPKRRGDAKVAYFLLLPTLLIFGVFTAYPFVYAAWLSLLNWDGFTAQQSFIGLANYEALLADPEFWNSLRITGAYTVGVTVLSLAAGLLVALALNQRIRGRTIYRAAYFTPVITATVAAGVVWGLLFDPVSGMVNIQLRTLGIEGPRWLSDPDWALPAIVIVGVWKRLGFTMAIYLAGLQTIPKSYTEAAAIDGAGAWQRFRHITWPLLTPTTALLSVMSVIDSFQTFDHVFIMTQGGPLGATDVLPMYLYREAFRLFHLGYAAAIGWVIFLIVFGATMVQWALSRGGGFRR